MCNREATSNNPVMDNTITSGLWYIICPLVPFLPSSGKWTVTLGPAGVGLREV